MKKLSCLVIEDEPLSQEVLAKYIAGVPGLGLAGICGDALSATGLLRNTPVDLIFLDINLPEVTQQSASDNIYNSLHGICSGGV